MTKDKGLNDFFGRDFSYSKKKGEIYDRLHDDAISPFEGGTMADVFFYAAVLGFRIGRREALVKPQPNIPLNAFGDHRVAVLVSMAVSDAETLDVLFHPDKAKTALEEYANAGIDLIEKDMLGGADAEPIERMAFIMKETLDKSSESA